jgi:LPS export ABC transporter protein LptC
MTWQKRARMGVAVFGIAAAIGVYTAIGERRVVTPAPPPPRIDPKAVIESSGAIVRQVRGTKLDYVINAERVLTYEDGSAKLMGVEIRVRERAGRDFVISGREAQAAEDKQDLLLNGTVVLSASDGLHITTDRAVFSQLDGIVRAPGAVEFQKGRMSGSGIGMTYDNNRDLLTIADQSRVRLLNEQENPQMEFTAGLSILSRPDDYLTLEGTVHGRNGEQVFDAERATARLTENEERLTLLELRGKAEVRADEGSFESMSANDIDLDYMDDGQTLERVVLSGRGSIEMMGWNEGHGRRILGDSLELLLASDGAITAATGRGGVQLDLRGNNAGPARIIRSKSLDATGEAGKGMTAARFTELVEYREEGRTGESPRSVKSNALRTTLEGNDVGSAAFTGSAVFEEQRLQAGAAEMLYEPAEGRLVLKGTDSGGGPRVSDEQLTIAAQSIGVTLANHQMTATGSVTTTLRAQSSQAGPGAAVGRLPGLLKQEQPANVHADALDYQGSTAPAVYTGNATLWQGDTAIRADTIVIDQNKGDLTARGAARSTLVLDSGTSIGRADGIRYDEATRTITYDTPIPAGRGGLVKLPPAQLNGPEGDLSADRIEVLLAKTAGGIARLEAYNGVNVRVGTRQASGARLTYFADDARYLIAASGTAPVKLIDGCRETTGKTVTFFKATDRVVVDGNEEIRTQSRSGETCAEPRPR